MGMMKNYIFDWLENYGFELGYDWDILPDLLDMKPDCPPMKEYFEIYE